MLGDYNTPISDWGSLGGDLASPTYTQPTTNSSSTGAFNSGSGFDWGTNITNWLKLAPNIIASARGNTYGSSQYGQGSFGQQGAQGQGIQASGSFLGMSGMGNISGTTLILIGVVAFVLLKRK